MLTAAGAKLLDSATSQWVDDDVHAAAVRELDRSRVRRVSLVDHVSFLVMRRRRVATAFAFDRDFVSAGFRLFPG